MHRDPAVGFDPGSPGSRPGPKAGAKPLRHPGIPREACFMELSQLMRGLAGLKSAGWTQAGAGALTLRQNSFLLEETQFLL